MEIIHPDIIEYNFILRKLCQGTWSSRLEISCQSYRECDEDIEGDVLFLPAPVALKKLDNYSILNSGNIFSYFSGPSIMLTVTPEKSVYVRKGDLVSLYYGKMLSKEFDIIVGTGEPVLTEPGRILELYNSGIGRIDLYEKWGNRTNYLPMPLYLGIINKGLAEVKGSLEKIVLTSIKDSLDDFNTVSDDIYREKRISNPDIAKMIILQFVNKRSISIGEEEIEAIKMLAQIMKENGMLKQSINI